MTRYRLFAGVTNAANMAVAEKERFARANAAYVLIYTTRRRPKDFAEIYDNETNTLTAEERQWLLDSNAVLLAEAIERERPELQEQIAAILAAYEAAASERGGGEQ